MAAAHEVSPSASRKTLVRLVLFSVTLGLGPLSAYFASLAYIWPDNATYAAITAILVANTVLVAYVVTSVLEDQGGAKPAGAVESKKDQ